MEQEIMELACRQTPSARRGGRQIPTDQLLTYLFDLLTALTAMTDLLQIALRILSQS